MLLWLFLLYDQEFNYETWQISQVPESSFAEGIFVCVQLLIGDFSLS